MAGPGHRANILSDDIHRIGLGVGIRRIEGMSPNWVVTEILASEALRPL